MYDNIVYNITKFKKILEEFDKNLVVQRTRNQFKDKKYITFNEQVTMITADNSTYDVSLEFEVVYHTKDENDYNGYRLLEYLNNNNYKGSFGTEFIDDEFQTTIICHG